MSQSTLALCHAGFAVLAVLANLGAMLGLTIGYLVKYQLDRRFVFDAEAVAA